MNKDSIGYTVIFSAIVCLLFVGILALVQASTAERVAKYAEASRKAAYLNSFGIAYSDLNEAEKLFNSKLTPVITAASNTDDEKSKLAYRTVINETEYFAVEQSGPGLWGTITIILAASADGVMRGIEIVAQNETPGLGGRIDEPGFKKQFVGKKTIDWSITIQSGTEAASSTTSTTPGTKTNQSGVTVNTVQIQQPGNVNDGIIDGITGATRTSKSMEAIVNKALEKIRALIYGTGGSAING